MSKKWLRERISNFSDDINDKISNLLFVPFDRQKTVHCQLNEA